MPDKLSEVILILVGSTLIIMVLFFLVIMILFINQKRKFRYKLEISNLKNEYDRELLKTQIEIQSQTFETISRELHDNAGTLLSIAMVHLKTHTGAENGFPNEKRDEVESLLNEAMDILRDVSRSLNPETITRTGWQQSFFRELERISRSGMFTIDTSVTGEPFPIEDKKQIILFRILQEAINNVVKHSEATRVSVRVEYKDAEMNITIRDNGKGISPQNVVPLKEGSGLRNMKARASMLPATFDVTSEEEKGTTIEIRYKNDNT